MAEIPIERKNRGGIPWWVWLLIALAVAALLFWLLGGRDDRMAQTPAAVTQSAPEVAVMDQSQRDGAEPITDLNSILSGDDNTLAGRQVQLTNVPAGEVPNDAGFWITGDNGAREYVILHEVRTPSTQIEGKINVDQGDRLDITGTVRSASEGVPKDAAIPGPTAPLPDGIKHYIEAERVTKTQ